MTRYARAKGSKASNERLPNEATPWHVMKEQLEQNVAKPDKPREKTKSAKELLQDKPEPYYADTLGNLNNDWAEFENPAPKKQKEKKASDSLKKKRKVETLAATETEPNEQTKKKKKKKQKAENAGNEGIESPEDAKDALQEKREKKNKDKSLERTAEKTSEPKNTLSKRQKRNMNRKKKVGESTENNQGNNESKSEGNKESNTEGNNESNTEGNKKSNTEVNRFKRFDRGFSDNRNKFDPRNKPQRKRKPPKVRDDLEHKRRKPDNGPVKMTINGVDIEIVKYDGFPVKKEDAERLKELRQKMIMKGIPKAELEAAMKLERRKAEKALARVKKCVCFHCRKSGHNLSDCPELGAEQAATGICFKCGSTEHTHFECKVAKPTEYRFATCFICREQGHIAKQCPDNPKGVYPQGGACKICGDVTHLKKDCPDLIKEKEESAITVDTIADGNLEALDKEDRKVVRKDDNASQRKVVKF